MKMLVKRELTIITTMTIDVTPEEYCLYHTGKVNLEDNLKYIDKSCIRENDRIIQSEIKEIKPYTDNDEKELQSFWLKRKRDSR